MELFATRCPWYVAGPAIGLIVVGMLWVLNRPLGATGGWIGLLALIRRPSAGGRWPLFFLVGVVLGGLLSALAAGGLHPGVGYGSFDQRFGTTLALRGVLLLVAGAVMGYGVRTAGGCTSGHGISGTALGSRASWVSTGVFMATAIAAANLVGWLLGARS